MEFIEAGIYGAFARRKVRTGSTRMARLWQTCGNGAVAKLRQGTLQLGRNKVNRNGIAQTGKGRKWNEAEVRRRDENGSGIE